VELVQGFSGIRASSSLFGGRERPRNQIYKLPGYERLLGDSSAGQEMGHEDVMASIRSFEMHAKSRNKQHIKQHEYLIDSDTTSPIKARDKQTI
jgi:hypothetical protein